MRGLSLVEAITAVFIILVAFFTFLTVASNSVRQGTQTRDEILADNLLLNVAEETRAHPFGSGHGWWGSGNLTRVYSVPVVIEGRRVETRYTCSVIRNPGRGNGSFFGARTDLSFDVLDIRLDWSEGTGVGSAGVRKTRALTTTVWRQGFAPDAN